ncbi:tripartite tricarboxylate transporter permease [Spiractinospora alimapuensis]|uniref:tripartite tricarboxylate transporter permease n=1 Tax=Spiractinospora alimapuensis TaxID=2820884 RepID=UPI001F1B0946|nr:tripartite tricarboxylate transporter permease [Spiractinospora alimapuensis]QVQ52274.1 tripartite tricarboxylate transporter permease [Spiractinospora alimapuensis]
MDALAGLAQGLSVVLSVQNLALVFFGVLLGTTIGVLPGLGTVAGAALVLPITFALEPAGGLMMIAGIYYGAMYAGSTTSILMNVPGEAASVVATFDGYKIARQGRAGPVLMITTIGSFVAGSITAVLVTLFAPQLAALGLSFGPAEFFALIVVGLIVLSTVSGGGLLSNLFPLVLGLMVGTIGQEPVSALSRFTFGNSELAQGIDIVPVAVGAFGIAELMFLAERKMRTPNVSQVRVRDLVPSREELRRSVMPWLRGTAVGGFFGLLPGPSGIMSTFASYRIEKSVSKHPERFGKGAIEGAAGPEAANSGAATSSVVPVLCLGLPFSATLALMLGAMMVHGVQPGPTLIVQHPEIFWGVIASMFIGNLILVILNVPLIGIWVSLLRTPAHHLFTVILLVAVVGSFSVNNSVLDVYLLCVFGVLGYLLRRYDFQIAPLVLGVILGPFLERYLVQSLSLGGGSIRYFLFSSPVTTAVWVGAVVALLGVLARRLVRRGRGAPERDATPLGTDHEDGTDGTEDQDTTSNTDTSINGQKGDERAEA